MWDNVFTGGSMGALHSAAAACGLGHTLYDRNLSPRTPLESALGSVLSELGDDAPLVEYWSRQEWKHIEAHADVDEALAAGGGSLRYPRHGHVLYLEVGERVRGPTCVWEPDGEPPLEDFGRLTTVPAVEGRLLRFHGQLQHAVPRPADVWLAPFVINEASTPPHAFVRSVCLFNTWEDREKPPLEARTHTPPICVRIRIHICDCICIHTCTLRCHTPLPTQHRTQSTRAACYPTHATPSPHLLRTGLPVTCPSRAAIPHRPALGSDRRFAVSPLGDDGASPSFGRRQRGKALQL